MESLLLKYIQENENWKEDLKKLHIEIREEHPLYLFKYTMDADFAYPLVQEARGIILDLEDMKVVAWPFRKFGNYGESYVDVLDWASARVQEKLDGSIIKLYYYNKQWSLATNGTINAFAATNQQGYNFGDLAFSALVEQGIRLTSLNKDYTYIFELTSPHNQIVVPYNRTTMWHIGTRNNVTGEELIVDINMPKPKEYPLYSLDDCIAFAKTFSSQEHEGFVVVDKDWNRVKVKSPDYIAAYHLKSNSILTTKKIIDLIVDGEEEEYLTYFPDKKEAFRLVHDKMNMVKIEIIMYCSDVERDLSRKDFALKYGKDEYFKFAVETIYDNRSHFAFSKNFWYNKIKE